MKCPECREEVCGGCGQCHNCDGVWICDECDECDTWCECEDSEEVDYGDGFGADYGLNFPSSEAE